MCEAKGVWVQLEGSKDMKGLEELCERRKVWTMLEERWGVWCGELGAGMLDRCEDEEGGGNWV